MSRQTAILVVESSQVGEARRAAIRFGELAGMNETAVGSVAIIATEMANNLARHATGGQLLIQILEFPHAKSVEMISIDSGPGMDNVERCLQDGYSTGGTSGTGLGAIRRLSSEFDIYSAPSTGTVVISRVYVGSSNVAASSPFQIGAASIPVAGETACGDGWKCSYSENQLHLMVADGLGHGPLAQEAADSADRAFDANPDAEPKVLIAAAHKALSGTRGAAIAVATLDVKAGELKYAGIGNIAGVLWTSSKQQGLASNNGIVGSQLPRLQQFDYSVGDDGLLIMNSDGLKSRWSLENYPGLAARHAAVIAGVLYRDYRRDRDDATVVVVRFRAGKV